MVGEKILYIIIFPGVFKTLILDFARCMSVGRQGRGSVCLQGLINQKLSCKGFSEAFITDHNGDLLPKVTSASLILHSIFTLR